MNERVMRNTAFIVTKPLQILVALSIIKQLGIHATSYLIIVDSFFDSKMVFERLKLADWEFSSLSIKFSASHRGAHQFINKNEIDCLFIDSDVGFRKYLNLLNLKIKHRALEINVYEEGLGTYRNDLYSGLKKEIFKKLGIGTHFGGSRFVKCLYLYNPEIYQLNLPRGMVCLKRIRVGIADILDLYFDQLVHIFDYSPVVGGGENLCHVYLSGWQVDHGFLEKFLLNSGDKFIKLHPHIKSSEFLHFGVLVKQTAPAELVLADLAFKYNEVNVYHSGSSVEKYFSKKNVNFLRV